jgi:hypothetical protein
VFEFKVDEAQFKARHSHCLSTWKNFIVMSGGIDENENPLNDIVLIDSETFEFKKFELTKGEVLPRLAIQNFINASFFWNIFQAQFSIKILAHKSRVWRLFDSSWWSELFPNSAGNLYYRFE